MYLLDTANVEEIKEAVEYYPLTGITTNPTLVAKESKDFFELLKEIREVIGKERMLHVQVLSEKAEDMLKEAINLNDKIGGNLYIKIPANKEGIKGIKLLVQNGIKVTATAICSPQQALMAASTGASFVAPYVNRTDDISGDGVQMVKEINELFRMNDLETKILSASFKNVKQVHEVLLNGSDTVTIPYALMNKLVSNFLSEWSVDKFVGDWEKVYGKGITTLNL